MLDTCVRSPRKPCLLVEPTVQGRKLAARSSSDLHAKIEKVELQPPANPLESCALRYRVGNIEIDAGTSTVRRSGRELALQPKIFGVLRYLLENRHRVISK